LKHASLQRVIAARTSAPGQDYGRQMALTVRRVSRIVAGPALVLMVGGQLAGRMTAHVADSASATIQLPGPPAPVFRELFSAQALGSSRGLMSLGLLMLAALPTLSVILILIDNARARRWREVLVAAGVVGILLLSSVIGH